MPERGEVALLFEYDSKTRNASLRGGALARNGYFSSKGIRNAYMHAVLDEKILEVNCNEKLENYFTN